MFACDHGHPPVKIGEHNDDHYGSEKSEKHGNPSDYAIFNKPTLNTNFEGAYYGVTPHLILVPPKK